MESNIQSSFIPHDAGKPAKLSRRSEGGLADLATHKTVPVHRHTVWYYWGGMTLLLIGQ